MDLQKERMTTFDWETMWDLFKVYAVGEMLLNGVKAFYIDESKYVGVKGMMGKGFKVE